MHQVLHFHDSNDAQSIGNNADRRLCHCPPSCADAPAQMLAAAAASHLAESTPTAAHLMPLLQSRAKAPISDPRCSALQRFLRAAPISGRRPAGGRGTGSNRDMNCEPGPARPAVPGGLGAEDHAASDRIKGATICPLKVHP